MASRIASLFVDLNLNTAKFIDELDKSRTKSTAFGTAVGVTLANIATSAARLGADIAASLPRAFLAAADSADQLSKSSQKIGIATEALSGLKHAAELSGVSFQSLETGLVRLSGKVFDAAGGAKAASTTFTQLGISLKDQNGNLRSTEGLLGDVAERFSKMPDGIEKTALATDLFGRSGAELIPLLNSGRAGLAAFHEEAERLGIVISGKTAAAAEQFNDNLDRLEKSLGGVALKVGEALLPAFAEATNGFVRFVTEGRKIEGIATLIARSLDLAGRAAGSLTEIFLQATNFAQSFYEGLARLNVGVTRFANTVTFGAFRKDLDESVIALDNIKRANEDIAGALGDVQEIRRRLLEGGFAGFGQDLERQFGSLPRLAEDVGEEAGQAFATGIKEPVDAALVEMEERWKALERDLQFTGLPDLPIVDQLGDMATSFGELDRIVRQIPLHRMMEQLSRDMAEAKLQTKDYAKEVGLLNPEFAKVTEGTVKLGGAIEAADTAGQKFGNEISGTLDRMRSGLADSIIEWKGFGDVALSTLKSIEKAIVEGLIGAALDPLISKISSAAGGFLGLGSSAASSAAASAAGSAAGGVAGAAGAGAAGAAGAGAAGAASGAGGAAVGAGIQRTLGTVFGGISAVSGIVGNFQSARLEGSLNAIALHTLQTINQLRDGIQPQINTYLPELASIRAASWEAVERLSRLSPRAAGGPVTPGSAYVVGERGPELFSPATSGAILPRGELVSRQQPITVHNEMHFHGDQVGRSRGEIVAMMHQAADLATARTIASLQDAARRSS